MPEGQLTVAARFCGTRAGQLYTGGIYALEELKASGDIGAFGAGINNTGSMTQFLDHGKPPVTVLLSLLALAATGLGRQLSLRTFGTCGRFRSGLLLGVTGVLADAPWARGVAYAVLL
jgi:hypothetical protein